MKFMFVAALAVVAAPAIAQTPAMPAPMPAPAATTVAKFNLDTPIEMLAADAKAKAVIAADLPDLLPHPAYETFKGMSLRQVQPYSNGVVTDEILKKVETDLAGIK